MNIIKRGLLRQIKPLYFGDHLQYALANPVGVRCFRTGTAALQKESSNPSKSFEEIMRERLYPKSYREYCRRWFQNLDFFKFRGFEKQKLEHKSYGLYQKTIASIDYQEFFDTFKIPNSFNSWFLITELHVWLLMVRAMAEGADRGADGQFIRNSIVKGMWADINSRLNNLHYDGLRSSQANQGVSIFNLHFQTSVISYDEGILGDDKILANALWVQFFNCDCDDLAKIDLLVKYVRKTTRALNQIDRESLFGDPKTNWLVPIKDIDIVDRI